MKTILIAFTMLLNIHIASCQDDPQKEIIQKWYITEVNINGSWQTVNTNSDEQGPYMWLKKGGDAECLFMMGISYAKWKYDSKTKILSIIEKDITSTYKVENITSKKLSLKTLGNIGTMDPAGLKLEAKSVED